MNTEERLTQYPSPGAKLALALSKAQSKIKPPVKNRHVDFTPMGKARVKYSYADLADVIAAVQGPLSENELAVTHLLCYQGDMYGLKTILIHSSGEFIDTWYPLPDPMRQSIRPQEFGSSLTYARRYSLSSIIGIASDEDDDGGNGAPTEPPKNKNQQRPQPTAKPPPLKNHAPGAENPPADALPDYDNPAPMSNLEKLYAIVEERAMPADEMKRIIKLVVGAAKKSAELTDDQVQAVIKYMNLTDKKGTDTVG